MEVFHFLIYSIGKFQASDDNKRKVLDNVIYLIRFPTMDQVDFFKSVATSRILAPEEALDVALHIKESTPRNKLPFSDKRRVGTWKEQLFTCSYDGQTQSCYSLQVTCNVQGNAEVASVYFVNGTSGNPINSLILASTNALRITKLENRRHCGQQLYEAIFDPPVKLQSGNHIIKLQGNGYFNAARLSGQNLLKYSFVTLSIQGNSWPDDRGVQT